MASEAITLNFRQTLVGAIMGDINIWRIVKDRTGIYRNSCENNKLISALFHAPDPEMAKKAPAR
jgi:hypothetical protein